MGKNNQAKVNKAADTEWRVWRRLCVCILHNTTHIHRQHNTFNTTNTHRPPGSGTLQKKWKKTAKEKVRTIDISRVLQTPRLSDHTWGKQCTHVCARARACVSIRRHTGFCLTALSQSKRLCGENTGSLSLTLSTCLSPSLAPTARKSEDRAGESTGHPTDDHVVSSVSASVSPTSLPCAVSSALFFADDRRLSLTRFRGACLLPH